MNPAARVSAIVTAHQRLDAVLNTLRILRACEPPPSEILVHVDDGGHASAAAIRREFPEITVLVSDDRIGPGGGRNRLVAAASSPIIASFDDDSYPIDRDYFGRVLQVFDEHPDAWVVDAHVYHLNQPIEPDAPASEWVADFSGGGCAYRRSRFLEVGGYVPLPIAYGMEEVDFGLRLHARGGRVLRSRRLRVFHDSDLSHHADPAITSASIANLALLTYLRYPASMWVYGFGQCVHRIQWLLRHGRRRGVLSGLAAIPTMLARYRGQRRPLPSRTVRSFLALRRHARPA